MTEALEPLSRPEVVGRGLLIGAAIGTLPIIAPAMFLTIAGAALGQAFTLPEFNGTFAVGSTLAGALLAVPVAAGIQLVQARFTAHVLTTESRNR